MQFEVVSASINQLIECASIMRGSISRMVNKGDVFIHDAIRGDLVTLEVVRVVLSHTPEEGLRTLSLHVIVLQQLLVITCDFLF